MTQSAILTLAFQTFWCASTGAAGARDTDTPTYKDEYGCPAISMKHVAGVLKDTARRIYGPDLPATVNDLFGTEGGGPGSLRFVGLAHLPQEDLDFFGDDRNNNARQKLFRRLNFTSIGETGSAKFKSLRSVEVCVPLTLMGHIEVDRGTSGDWIDEIDKLAAATQALGYDKANLGRVVMSCAVDGNESAI